MSKINLFGTVNDSIVDGPGLRYVVFTQGCPHKCKGCHNPESQEFKKNKILDVDEIIADIKSNPLIKGLTISGGEPFSQVEACAELAKKMKAYGYNIWCYTGGQYEKYIEEAKKNSAITSLLNNIDVLVDGPFIKEKMSYSANWCGSTNQRLIDMNKTRKTGKIVLFEAENFTKNKGINFKKPESW